MWFWPLVCIGAGIALSVISVAVDRAFDGALIPRALTGGPDAALEILGTVGLDGQPYRSGADGGASRGSARNGSILPRIVATILQDKPSQFAIGTFVGTFAHAMLSLSQVAPPTGPNSYPAWRSWSPSF